MVWQVQRGCQLSQDRAGILAKLMELDTEGQVENFLRDLMPEKAYKWIPLGGELDPAGLIGAQPDPIKALIERIVNMHDATIEKGRLRNDSEAEPDTPREAVARWLGLSKDLSKEDDDALRETWGRQNRVQFVLTNRKGFPTVKFRDLGTGCVDAAGQLNLKATILSLLHRNKATKKYVAGLFGFGGSTTLWHCNYSIVISRPRRSSEVRDAIGWTIVRRRPPVGNEKRDQFEYVIGPDSNCPYVDGGALPDAAFPAGTFVAHIEYNLRTIIGTSDLIVTGSDMLYQRMRYLLFNPVLPFWLEAVGADHKPLKVSQARNMSGNLRILNKAWELDKSRKLENRQQVLLHGKYSNKDGLVIRYWIFNVRKGENQEDEAEDAGDAEKQPNPYISRYLETWHKRKADPIVLTINGQTHYSFPVSTFRQFRLQLLENYLLVQIDLDEMKWGVRRDIFNKIASTRYDLKQELHEMLIEELDRALGKDNQPLWAIVDFLVEKILSQTFEDTRIDKLLRRIILNYESRRVGQGVKVLGMGSVPTTGHAGSPEYRPNYIPTRFQFDEYPDPLEIGIGSKKTVRILTDAPDDIQDRDSDRGEIEIMMPDDTPITAICSKPSNGVITLSLIATNDVEPGLTTTVKAKLRIIQNEDPVELETEPLNLTAVEVEEPSYTPVDPPTKLKIISLNNPIKLKRGRATSIALEFDGPDDIFERETRRAEMLCACTIEGVDASLGKLAPNNGRITAFVKVPETVAVGNEGTITFHLSVAGLVLEDSRRCVVEEPSQRVKRYGEPYSDEMTANFEARWVYENDVNWTRLGFTQDHNARAESLPDGKLMVWVNWDNARLKKFYKFRRERVNEGEAKLDAERYRMQIAYYGYQRNKQGLADNDDEGTQKEYQRVAETTMIGLLPLNQIGLF